MLFNPKVGMRVRCISSTPLGGLAFARLGTVKAVLPRSPFGPNVVIDFDDLIYMNSSTWGMYLSELEAFELTPEEQDRQRRNKHAEKYL